MSNKVRALVWESGTKRLLGFAVGILLFLLFGCLMFDISLGSGASFLVVALVPYTALLAGSLIYGVQRGFQSRSLFVYRYPVSAGELSKAYLKDIGRLFALLLLITFLLDIAICLFAYFGGGLVIFWGAYFAEEVSLQELVAYALRPAATVGLLAWAALAVMSRGMLVALVVLPLVLLGGEHTGWMLGPLWMLWALGLWSNAWRKRVVPSRWMVLAAGAWILLTLLLTGVEPRAGFLIAAGFASLGPLAVVVHVLDVNRARHGAAAAKASSDVAPLSTSQRVRLAAGFLVCLAFVTWLNIPETPVFVQTWRNQGFPATPEDLRAWYPAPSKDERVPHPLEGLEATLESRASVFNSEPDTKQLRERAKMPEMVLPRPFSPEANAPLDDPSWKLMKRFDQEVTDDIFPLIGTAVLEDVDAYEHRWDPLGYNDYCSFSYAVNRPGALFNVVERRALVAAIEERPHDATAALLLLFPLAGFSRYHPHTCAQGNFLQDVESAAWSFELVLSRVTIEPEDLYLLQSAYAAAMPDDPAYLLGFMGARVNVLKWTPLLGQ